MSPLTAAYLFRNKLPDGHKKQKKSALGFIQRFIDSLRNRYENSLIIALKYKWFVLGATAGVFLFSLFVMKNQLGYELFPQSDVGQMEIQVRMESGTPLKTAEKTIAEMEQVIREELGDDLKQIISNIGIFYDLPAAYTPNNSGTQDAFIGIQLREKHIVSTFDYASRLRKKLKDGFPGIELSFDTGGLITAALNEGKPAPVDVQIIGNDLKVMFQVFDTTNHNFIIMFILCQNIFILIFQII